MCGVVVGLGSACVWSGLFSGGSFAGGALVLHAGMPSSYALGWCVLCFESRVVRF